MQEGTIVAIAHSKDGKDRGFGFVQADGGGPEVFVLRSQMRGIMNVGDRIKFNVEETEKGPRATGVIVLSRAIPTSSPAPTPLPVPDQTPTPQPAPTEVKAGPPLEVSWRFDPPRTLDGLIRIKTWIAFGRAGHPVPGVHVELFKVDKDGAETQVLTPAKKVTTDRSGEVYFAVFLTPEQICELRAKSGRDTYTHPLPFDRAAALPPPVSEQADKPDDEPSPTTPPPAKATRVEVQVFSLTHTNWNPVRLITKDASDNRTQGEVTIITGQNSLLWQGDRVVLFTNRLTVTTDERDHDLYLIKLMDRDTRATFICSDTVETHTLLKEQ